jgi:ectoine hydroxylase-related dioxygenase (phytanoyl-CoA dioxygenase family)
MSQIIATQCSACIAHDPSDLDHRELLERGYIIFPEVLSRDQLAAIHRELSPWLAATPRCEGDFYGWNTTRINSVLVKARSTHALALHPRILAAMDSILRPYCDWYQLNLSQVIRVHSGERQQFPHRDDDMWPCAKTHEYMVNVMWALSPFTAENGATLIWPTKHDGSPAAAPIAASMPAGSALIYLGSTQHCAGANRSDQPRTGLIFSYSLGWLKPYENPFLAYPPQVARTFPKALRDLIGYRIHRPNLGHYEGQDPSAALASGSRVLATRDALPPEIAAQLAQHYRSPKV